MSKLINISDRMYEKLKAMKSENESFTIIIEKLVEKKKRSNKEEILKFAGKGGINDKAIEDLKKGWGKWNERYA
ncbi:MAG: antitoxin VapB family protein [Nanoarchaeota archaeon]